MGAAQVVLDALEKNGILLLQDKVFPSVAGLIAGEPIRGSWWSHKRAHEIFRVLETLEDNPAVLLTRLIAGKVTFLHRRLWPDFLAIAIAREPWQIQGLTIQAARLLAKIEKDESVRAKGPPSKELQRRLLVHAAEVHTESGRHETELQTWSKWMTDHHASPSPDPEAAKRRLEDHLERLGTRRGTLPWVRS